MSRKPILRIYEDSDGSPARSQLIIPPRWNNEGPLEAVPLVIHGSGKALILDLDSNDVDIQHRRDTWNTGPYEDLDCFDEVFWRDFLEGLDEISPPLIQVYPYLCGICHKEELYAEDPLDDWFSPYHVHGKPKENGHAKTYHLRRLALRWVPNNTPMVLYGQKSGGIQNEG